MSDALQPPAPVEHQWVDSPEALIQLTEEMAKDDWIVIDSEADSFHHYFEKICLLQIETGGRIYLVDPLVDLDWTPFFAELGKHILVIHGADYDLRLLRQSFDFRPDSGIFDTSIAAQLLGLSGYGLASLVAQFCQVKLPKDNQRSDWSQRPLTDRQKAYAANDVIYLRQVATLLKERLLAKERLEWQEQMCESLIQATAQDRQKDPDMEWRIKGAHELSRRELAFLKELWTWREGIAQSIDRPTYMILGNGPLMALVKACARATTDDLPILPDDFKLPRNIKGKRLADLQEAVTKAKSTSPDQYPRHPKTRGKRLSWTEGEIVKKLKKELQKVADSLEIDAPLIASRSTLTTLSRFYDEPLEKGLEAAELLPWQRTFVAPLFQKICQHLPTKPEEN